MVKNGKSRMMAALKASLITLAFAVSPVQAGIIASATNVGGTGGTSTLILGPGGPVLDNGNPTTPSISGTTTFTGPGYIDTVFNVNPLGGFTLEYLVSDQVAFPSANAGYSVFLGTGTGGSFIEGGIPNLDFDFGPPGGDPAPSSTNPAYTLVSYQPTSIVWSGSAPSSTFSFAIDVPDFGVAPYTFTLRQVTATPEPGTWALFGVGLAGLAFSLRRRKKGEAVSSVLA